MMCGGVMLERLFSWIIFCGLHDVDIQLEWQTSPNHLHPQTLGNHYWKYLRVFKEWHRGVEIDILLNSDLHTQGT